MRNLPRKPGAYPGHCPTPCPSSLRQRTMTLVGQPLSPILNDRRHTKPSPNGQLLRAAAHGIHLSAVFPIEE